MAQFGSNRGLTSQSIGGVVDNLGNIIVSSGNDFGAAPLGVAPVAQSVFGIPNPTFDLLPPDPTAEIDDSANALPYWSITNSTNGIGSIKSSLDSTTNTRAIEFIPGTAASGDTMTMTTRSYVVSDDNLGIRQKAYALLSKGGSAYAGTTQWNLVMSATYYDHLGAQLSTYNIGTVYDNTTWTTINGFTTSGGSAISASAAYVDIAFTWTATAAITSGVTFKIKSLLLATRNATQGAFVIAERYTASTTWTRPTGVDYVSVWAVGAGAGGGSGTAAAHPATSGTATAGRGGGGGAISYVSGLYVGDQTTISIGVGTGGVGGGAAVFTKTATTATGGTTTGTAGANGGNTTFGTYITAQGGQGEVGGTATLGIYGDSTIAAGGNQPSGASPTAGYLLPYHTIYAAAGSNSGTVASTGTGNANSTPTSTGGAGSAVSGAGGSGQSASSLGTAVSNGGSGGAGGGGPRINFLITATGTATATAGNGGNASANSGAGGGGGGASFMGFTSPATATNFTASRLVATSGAGGNGGDGYVIVIYTA